jgi:hypothetical protein
VKTNAEKGLQIQLKIVRDSYAVGEPVEVELVLLNQSEAPVTVNKRMAIFAGQMAEGNWEVKFDIKYPPGERLVRGAKIRREELNKDDFAVISAGENIHKTFNLSRYYWLELPGPYEVKAFYHNSKNGQEFGSKAWTGDLNSNSISFKVTR